MKELLVLISILTSVSIFAANDKHDFKICGKVLGLYMTSESTKGFVKPGSYEIAVTDGNGWAYTYYTNNEDFKDFARIGMSNPKAKLCILSDFEKPVIEQFAEVKNAYINY